MDAVETETKYIQTTVSSGAHLVLHMEAKCRKMTLTNLLREIIHEWINKQSKGGVNNGSKETSEKA